MNEAAQQPNSHYRTARQKIKIIIDHVAKKHDVLPDEILGRRRGAGICAARNEAMHIVREAMDLSTTKIGHFFDRDHSTVIHALKKHKEAMEKAR